MRRTLRTWIVVSLAALGAPLTPSCAGCSEECSDQKAGSEGCPCQSDQDCTTRQGEVLLCGDDGACAPGDPADAPGTACDGDGDCGDGERCGLGLCSPAPACQRIDAATLRARRRAGAVINPVADATVERSGCTHAVVGAGVTLELAGISPKTGEADVSGDCTAGTWFAAQRAGVFACGTGVVVLSVLEPCFVGAADICATGTCTSLGSPLDEDAGVCR